MHPPTKGTICQYGSGSNFPVYRGLSRQYGYGLGSIFKTAFRAVMPVLKPLAKAGLQSAKHIARDQGINVLRDIVEGKNVKQVLKSRGKTALKKFGMSTLDHLVPSRKHKKVRRPNKPHSSSGRRRVHIKKGRKIWKFDQDIFDRK